MSKQSTKASKEQADILMKDAAKRYGHHGVDVVVATIRQKYNIAADPEYIRQLIEGPKS